MPAHPLVTRSRRALWSLHTEIMRLPPAVALTGLGCLALAASSDLANTFDAPRRGGPFVASLLFLTLLAAFACFLLATRLKLPARLQRHERLLRLLLYPVLAWALFTAPQTAGVLAGGVQRALTVSPPHYGSDDLYYNHYNAWLVLHGQNPYTGPWLASEVRYFGDRAYTPLARGRFSDPRHYPSRQQMGAVVDEYLAHPAQPPPELDPATTHSYPAGAFLVAIPAVWAGLPSVTLTQLLLLLLVLALAVWAAPTPLLRVVVLLLLLSTTDGVRQVAGSDFEIWPLALLLFAWLARERRWTSAVLVGAACAIKQTAWLALPFYLIWVWRSYGRDEALRRGAVAVCCFFALNLPWLLASPGAWLASVLLPVRLPLLPDGSGLIGLSLTGVLPLFPPVVYSALELAALLAAMVWYWRKVATAPFVALVLPLLPLLLAWRSSERYFVLLPVAAVFALVLALRADSTQQASPFRRNGTGTRRSTSPTPLAG
jgi:hypothetical protein